MANAATTLDDGERPPASINPITPDHPWQWIAKGWFDLLRAPLVSLGYGVLFVAASHLLTALILSSQQFFLVPPLAAGFFLVAPILTIGLYEMSRRLEQGDWINFPRSLGAWNRNPTNLALFGLVLLMAFVFWIMIANLVFALFYSGSSLTIDNFIPQLFLSGDNATFLFAGILSGSLIAMAVFTISAISVPMLIDGERDLLFALRTSASAVIKNPRPMLLWASLIVMFVVLGMVTFYIGFLVFIPLLGHASWHAYRDLTRTD